MLKAGISGKYCIICGHPLSPNNEEGIGHECKKAVRYAKKVMLLSTDEGKSKYYNRDLSFLKPLIKNELNKKLRNEFKINFLSSVKDANFLSKRQREVLFTLIDIDFQEYNKHMDDTQEQLLNEITPSRELVEIARKRIRENKNNN